MPYLKGAAAVELSWQREVIAFYGNHKSGFFSSEIFCWFATPGLQDSVCVVPR